MGTITVRQWNEATFLTHNQEWNGLLEQSSADRFFLSWEWLSTWWKTFGSNSRFEPYVLGAYDSSEKLVGAAALYLHDTKLRGLFPIHRLQFMGNCWREKGNIRSEYSDFVVCRGMEERVIREFLQYIDTSSSWDEFVICGMRCDSPAYKLIKEFGRERRFFTRGLEGGESQAIVLEGDFPSYLFSISARTRAKLYNQRKRLESHGKVEIVSADRSSLDDHFRILNSFHQKRWGKNVFEGKRLEFHRSIASLMLERNNLNFSVLYVGQRPMSALYDFQVDGVEYGYQLGFDSGLDKNLSPSILHIGYTIERAYTAGLHTYDMLRGTGKNIAYKDHITMPFRSLQTVQIVRDRKLQWLYHAYAMLRPAKNQKGEEMPALS